MKAQFKYFKTICYFEKRSRNGKSSIIILLSRFDKYAEIRYHTYTLNHLDSSLIQDSTEAEFLKAYQRASNRINKMINL